MKDAEAGEEVTKGAFSGQKTTPSNRNPKQHKKHEKNNKSCLNSPNSEERCFIASFIFVVADQTDSRADRWQYIYKFLFFTQTTGEYLHGEGRFTWTPQNIPQAVIHKTLQ